MTPVYEDKGTIIRIVETAAMDAGVDPDLAVAIASVESAWNPWAVRFEPVWKHFTKDVAAHATRLGISRDTELNMQACSWGVMQVMGAVARELGFKEHLHKLCVPEIGALYGCRKLAAFFAKYKNDEDTIAAYNAGTPRKNQMGLYSNQAYVNKVKDLLTELRFISSRLSGQGSSDP